MIRTEFPHYDHVQGWLEIEALRFTSYFVGKYLSDIAFDSIEIGVYHGKCLIAIENLTPEQGRCLAVDVFSQQDKNIDRSGFGAGAGHLEAFTANYQAYARAPGRIVPIEQDSLDIDCGELGPGKFGIVSIDGGHTERHTVNDLRVAQELFHERGIVILDDVLNQDWLGVVSGACTFFNSPLSSRLVPFAIGFNKLFCCHFSIRGKVHQAIAADQEALREIGIAPVKVTEFAGNRVISLNRCRPAAAPQPPPEKAAAKPRAKAAARKA